MMLELLPEDHELLKMRMPEVADPAALEPLTKDMFLIMWSNGGIGLAAPQVGMALRMFIMGPQEGPHYVCINPEIVATGPTCRIKEGCLSFPGLWLNIDRPEWVDARYQTLDGSWVEQRFTGLLARCYLHELDHLDGHVFTEYANTLSLKMARDRQLKYSRKLKKAEKQA